MKWASSRDIACWLTTASVELLYRTEICNTTNTRLRANRETVPQTSTWGPRRLMKLWTPIFWRLRGDGPPHTSRGMDALRPPQYFVTAFLYCVRMSCVCSEVQQPMCWVLCLQWWSAATNVLSLVFEVVKCGNQCIACAFRIVKQNTIM